MAVSLMAHMIIWSGNSLVVGVFPFPLWLQNPATGALTPLCLALCSLSILASTAIILGWIHSQPEHASKQIMRTPRFWWSFMIRFILVTLWMPPMLGLVVIFAGPLSPAIIESANLLAIYTLTIFTGKAVFNRQELRTQGVWLGLMILGVVSFIMLIEGQRKGWDSTSILSVLQPQLGLAMLISLLIHGVLWVGIFWSMGVIPALDKAFFGNQQQAMNAAPTLLALLCTILGAWLWVWVMFQGGAEQLFPASMATQLANPGYQNRIIVWLIVSIPLAPMFLWVSLEAGLFRPVIIGLSNIVALVIMTTLTDPHVHWGILTALAFIVLCTTSLRFAMVQQRHEQAASARTAASSAP
jgi:hypothetical protein